MCGALKLSGIVRANFRLNIAIAMLFLSLIYFLGSEGTYKFISPVDRPVVPGQIGPSPEQKVYVYVPFSLPIFFFFGGVFSSKKGKENH